MIRSLITGRMVENIQGKYMEILEFAREILMSLAIFFALFGIYVTHYFTSKRDSYARKKEKRIDYLHDAYMKLERGSNPVASHYSSADFESAVAQIQLYGTHKEIQLVNKFCESASRGDGDLLQDLLEDLRVELRNELFLSNDELPKIRPFRITKPRASTRRAS